MFVAMTAVCRESGFYQFFVCVPRTFGEYCTFWNTICMPTVFRLTSGDEETTICGYGYG